MIAAIIFAVACALTLARAFLPKPLFGRVDLGWLGVAVFILFFAIMAIGHPPS